MTGSRTIFETRAPWAAGVAAVVVRLAYCLEIRHSVFFLSPLLDAAWYDQWAQRIAAGHIIDGAPYFQPPLYAWYLAIIHALFGGGPWAPRLVQAVLAGGVAAGAAWVTGRLFRDRWAPLAAGLIVALYGPSVFVDGELLPEALLIPLLAGALVFLAAAGDELRDEDGRLWPWFAGGLCLGGAAITRPDAAVLLPAALLIPWSLWPSRRRRAEPPGPGPAPLSPEAVRLRARSRRIVIPLLAGFALPILPVTAVNFATSGDLIWIASGGGVGFYAGNNSRAEASRRVIHELSDARSWEDLIPLARVKAAEAVGHPLRAGEASRYWAGRGLTWLRRNPGPAARLYAARLGAFLCGYEAPGHRDIQVARRESLVLSGLVGRFGPLFLPWGILLPLAVLGVAAAPLRRDQVAFLAMPGLYALSLLPVGVDDRARLPVALLLAPWAGVGLLRLSGFVRTRSYPAWPVASAAMALVLANLTYGADVRGNPAESWRSLGEALATRGNPAGALEAFDRAAALAPGDPWSRLGRARALESLGQDSLAGAEYAAVAARLPESWQAQYACGRFLLNRGHPAEAIPFLEHAAGIRPDRGELHRDLGFAYEATGRDREAGLALTQALRLGQESAELHLSLGLVALRRGSPELAENNWRRSLELDPHHFRSLYNLGLLRFEQGRLDDAETFLKSAASERPDDPQPFLQLARLASRRGERVLAGQRLAIAIQKGADTAAIRRDPLLKDLEMPTAAGSGRNAEVPR